MPKFDPDRNSPLNERQRLLRHGFGMSSPGYWAHFVNYRWSLIQDNWASLHHVLDANEVVPEIQGEDARFYYATRIHYEGISLVHGARHVVRYCELYERHLSLSANTLMAHPRYDALADVADARDMIEHFDEYSVGSGRRKLSPVDGAVVTFPDQTLGSATLNVGHIGIHLPPAVDAVAVLAKDLDAIWDSARQA